MTPVPPSGRRSLTLALFATLLVVTSLWLRWPTFGFSLWNVDEAIHAAAARTILDGGVLYRDAIDQRTPLSYYAVAAIFAVCGENNLWAVRCLIALLIAGTAWLLFFAGRTLRDAAAGLAAATLYVLLSTGVLFQGDAFAANTEWFVAFFSSAAAVVFLAGGPSAAPRRVFVAGLLLGCSFLSKQPALLDLAAPGFALAYAGWRQSLPRRRLLFQFLALAAGWLTPVLLAPVYFAAHGALRDFLFCAWTYNLSYYGAEITTAARFASGVVPFRLIGATQPWLFGLWATGAVVTLHRLLQRNPTPAETAANPGRLFLTAWSLAGLAGAASGGRGFDHYSIQFLAPFCLGAGLVLAQLAGWAWSAATRWPGRIIAAILLAVVVFAAGSAALSARRRTVPEDASLRVSAYIRAMIRPGQRVAADQAQPA